MEIALIIEIIVVLAFRVTSKFAEDHHYSNCYSKCGTLSGIPYSYSIDIFKDRPYAICAATKDVDRNTFLRQVIENSGLDRGLPHSATMLCHRIDLQNNVVVVKLMADKSWVDIDVCRGILP